MNVIDLNHRQQERLLNIEEAANFLNISVHTLRSWVSQRRIPFIKLGSKRGRVLFKPSDLIAFINSHKVEPYKPRRGVA